MRAEDDAEILFSARRGGEPITYQGRLIIGSERELVLTFGRTDAIELREWDGREPAITLAGWEAAERRRAQAGEQ